MVNTYDFSISQADDFKKLTVRDLLMVYYKCPQEEKKINLYTHYNEIAFTLNGKKCLHHRNKSWMLTENKGIFIRKTAYNQEKFWEAEWEVLAFYFPDEFIIEVMGEARSQFNWQNLPPAPTDMLFNLAINERSRAFLYSMIPYFNSDHPPSDHLLMLKFKEMLWTLISDPENAHMLAYMSKVVQYEKPMLDEIMESNYMFNLSVEEFAKMTSRSVTTFKRDFKTMYNTSPAKWLAEKRIMYAAAMLKMTNKQVDAIAYESGYENVSHFCRIFKEKNGITPHQYRKVV